MELTQIEINEWELEHFNRIIKWVKDFTDNTIVFYLDDPKTGRQILFKII